MNHDQNTLSRIILLVIGVFLIAPNSFAWSGAGHMLIAAEAFRSLPTNVQDRAVAVLMAHPNYEKWEKDFVGTSGLNFSVYIFMRSSTWPDEIRRKGNEYDHPQWHFIDYPLKPPSFPLEPGPAPNDDILFGIQQSENVLSDTNASNQLKAVYLSWLIHLIGDLHQPLHCSSLINADFPSGDKGGNGYYIRPGERAIKMHSFWDGLLGTSSAPNPQFNYAIENQAHFPRAVLPELIDHKTAKEWSLESRSLAIEKAYLRCQLKGGKNLDEAVTLPADYGKAAKSVAERQAALAGYRLADEISRCLK